MTRKMLFRRAVAGLAKEETAKRRSDTIGDVVANIRGGSFVEGVDMLEMFVVRVEGVATSESLAENRRLRGEVRRLRAALRDAAESAECINVDPCMRSTASMSIERRARFALKRRKS